MTTDTTPTSDSLLAGSVDPDRPGIAEPPQSIEHMIHGLSVSFRLNERGYITSHDQHDGQLAMRTASNAFATGWNAALDCWIAPRDGTT